MASQQSDIKSTGEPCRQLRASVLERCADTALVAQYKSFRNRVKAERNAFAGGHLDDAQLQQNLRQLRAEKAECVCRIEASIRQSGSQALERVEQGSLALARKTFAEADGLEQAAKRLRQTAARQEELGRIAGSVGRVCLGAATAEQADQDPSGDEEEVVEPPAASASKPNWEETLRSEELATTESPALWAARAAAHRECAKEAMVQKRAAEKAAKKEKADGYRSLTEEALRAKLSAAGLDSGGSKAALVRRFFTVSTVAAAASGSAARGSEVALGPGSCATVPPAEEDASAPPAPSAQAQRPAPRRPRLATAGRSAVQVANELLAGGDPDEPMDELFDEPLDSPAPLPTKRPRTNSDGVTSIAAPLWIQKEKQDKAEEEAAAEAAVTLDEYRRLLALGGKPIRLRGINIQWPWA